MPEHLKISSGEIYQCQNRYYQGKIFDFDSVIFCLGQVLSFLFTSKWGYTDVVCFMGAYPGRNA